MIKLKTIGKFGLLSVIFMAGVFAVSQLVANTYAAQTLSGTNEIITIGDTTDGLPVNAEISPLAYSGDGNIVLFRSAATNLRDAGYSGSYVYSSFSGLYTYNIQDHHTSRIDMSTSGQLPTAPISDALMSDSGRYVIFISRATNLIDGTTNNTNLGLAYLRDTRSSLTTFLGGNSATNTTYNTDRFLGISDDSRFILLASRYRGNTYPYNYRILLSDRSSGVTTPIFSYNDGNEGSPSVTTKGTISCDGSFTAYQQGSSVELLDLRSGAKIVVAKGNNSSMSPRLSCNGRYLLYATTNRTDITTTPSGMNQYMHLVRYDRVTGERMYIDSNSTGVFSSSTFEFGSGGESFANVFSASIADTGDVVFNYNGNYYLKHLSDGSNTLESVAKKSNGAYINVVNENSFQRDVSITSDGRYIFFKADPYALGLAPSPSTKQLIRTKTGI